MEYKLRKNIRRWETFLGRTALGLLIFILIAGSLYAGLDPMENRIHPNVRVGGIDIGGMTMERAYRELKYASQEVLERSVLWVDFPESSIPLEPQNTKASLNCHRAVWDAWLVGRLRTRSNSIRLKPYLRLDEQYIRQRIDLYAMTYTATQESMDAFLQPIWEEVTPEMESVSSVVLVQGDEYSSYMQLTAYLAASDGDIYFLTEQFFKTFAAQGAFLPLEQLVEDGVINVGDLDLTKGYVTMVSEYDENYQPLKSEMHLYGIPMDSFYGFMDGMQFDNRGMYAVILFNNQNDENVIPFFDALLEAGRGEKEEWIQE